MQAASDFRLGVRAFVSAAALAGRCLGGYQLQALIGAGGIKRAPAEHTAAPQIVVV